MNRWGLGLAGLLVLLAGVGWWWAQGDGAAAEGPDTTAASRAAASAAALGAAARTRPPSQDQLGGQPTLARPAQATVSTASMGTDIDRLGLARRLEGEHRLRFDERDKQVLGSKDVVEGGGVNTIVYTRDLLSGQVDAWQAALRFGLQPGASADAVFSDHPVLRRALVSGDRAEASVPVDQLAAQYRALLADPRVAGVRLMPLVPRESPK